GEVEVRAELGPAGEVRRRVQIAAGEVARCDLQVVRNLAVKGRIRDEDGQPVPNVDVRWSNGAGAEGMAVTARDGTFALTVIATGDVAICLSGSAIRPVRFDGIDPRRSELELRVERRQLASAYIAGTVLGPDGRPVPARITARGRGE